jgi:hypothetical protein
LVGNANYKKKLVGGALQVAGCLVQVTRCRIQAINLHLETENPETG